MSEDIESLAPTPERFARGRVEQLAEQIADEEGRPSAPYRAIDLLAALERRGRITKDMRQAGEDFRAAFRCAHIGNMRASDPSRPYISGTKFDLDTLGPHKARESFYRCIDALGGIGSPASSVMWHIVGLEWSMREWVIMYSNAKNCAFSEKEARGMLIGALCSLTAYYGYK